MHADIIKKIILHTQSNLCTVSEPSEIKPNLVDQTRELLKWLRSCKSYIIQLLQNSSGNIPSWSWPKP